MELRPAAIGCEHGAALEGWRGRVAVQARACKTERVRSPPALSRWRRSSSTDSGEGAARFGSSMEPSAMLSSLVGASGRVAKPLKPPACVCAGTVMATVNRGAASLCSLLPSSPSAAHAAAVGGAGQPGLIRAARASLHRAEFAEIQQGEQWTTGLGMQGGACQGQRARGSHPPQPRRASTVAPASNTCHAMRPSAGSCHSSAHHSYPTNADTAHFFSAGCRSAT